MHHGFLGTLLPRRRWYGAVALGLAAAFLALSAPPAGSDLVGFDPGITHDLYTEAGTARCVYGPGNCSLHSFTFASANDIVGVNGICAEIYNPSTTRM